MSYIGKQPTKAPLTASDIEDGIITAAKIEDGAVVAAEIASNAVTTAKINADAVTGAKIADDAINSEHYTDGSVDTAHIADANITTAKIADDAITAAKINNDIISGSTELASEPADTDEFLVSDAGTLKRIDYSLIKGGGKINQVLNTSPTINSTSSSAVELFSLAITPSASNSKISIIYSASAQLQNNEYASFDLYRGSLSSGTKIQDGGQSIFVAGSSANIRMYYSASYLDSPNTTSATTYTVVGVPELSSTIQFGATGINSITLMEVLA